MAHLLHRIASFRDSEKSTLDDSGGTADLAGELLDGIEDYENELIGSPAPIKSRTQSGKDFSAFSIEGPGGPLDTEGRSLRAPGGPLRYRRQISFSDSLSTMPIHSGGGDAELVVQAAMDRNAMPSSSVYFDERTL